MIHAGEIGITLSITATTSADVIYDISGASAMALLIKSPLDVVVERVAEFTTDGTDGALQYVTVEGDLDSPGLWEYQAKITWPSGKLLFSTSVKFKAVDSLKVTP